MLMSTESLRVSFEIAIYCHISIFYILKQGIMESFTGAGTAIGPAIGGFLRPVGLSDELYLIYEFDAVTVS